MKIGPIQQNAYVSLVNINKQEKKEAKTARVIDNAPNASFNEYGKYLVNFKSREAEILKKISTIPVDYKLENALKYLTSKEILVLTNNINKANNILKANIDKIDIAIKKIKYLLDPKIEDMLLFAKDIEETGNRLINLNEKPLEICDNFGVLDKVQSGESRDVVKLIEIKTGLGVIRPTHYDMPELEMEKEVLLNCYPAAYLREASFDNEYKKAIKALNQKIFSAEIEKPKTKNKRVTTFADVGGQDYAIKQLKKKLVYPIQHPEAYKYYKNKGVLLYGPPGTGKSLLAEAVGNEVNVSFFSVGGTDFKDKFVGGSEKAFEEQIQKAIDAQPSILFIDEVDSLARQRGSGDVHADSLLNKVLHSMTKLQGEEVYLIAATNNIDLLDKAFLRSGRFGAQIKIGAPDLKGTEQIFDIHLKDKLDKNLDKSKVIQKMYDLKMVGADIAIAISEAYENAFERLGIEKAMDEGRYTPAMLDYLELTQEDFDVAFKNFKERNNKQTRNPIGFGK